MLDRWWGWQVAILEVTRIVWDKQNTTYVVIVSRAYPKYNTTGTNNARHHLPGVP